MAIATTKHIILAIILVDLIPKLLINGQQVPCYFPFGDSYSDAGNNNNLISLAKANFLPYGIDYVDGPTGRFSNGLNIADVLAKIIGLPSSPPPYATARGSNAILRGINYASAGGGILEGTGLQVLGRSSMNQQLRNHQETVNKISSILGNQTAANNLLRKCLYTLTMGNNDYIINYYYLQLTPSNILFTPEQFADRLIQQYSKQLTTLYNLQARKVAVFGVGPTGCLPNVRSLYPTKASPCVEFVNDSVQLFNNKLIALIKNLNANLPGANFTYINYYSFLKADLTTILGIKVPYEPCCQTNGQLLGLCTPNGRVCNNRDEYSYMDMVDPTQIVYNYSASRAYTAESSNDAIPVDIRTLLQQ